MEMRGDLQYFEIKNLPLGKINCLSEISCSYVRGDNRHACGLRGLRGAQPRFALAHAQNEAFARDARQPPLRFGVDTTPPQGRFY